MNICFATNNDHKLREIRDLAGNSFNILSLKDIGCHEELPENGATLAENSLEKAAYVHKHYNIDCFADDTGLEVHSLNGEPGVYSARYAGEHKSSDDNITLLLSNLGDRPDRAARFKTVITLILKGQTYQFEGIVEGVIAPDRRGGEGFGYDPVFIPEGGDRSFAEMSMQEKGSISHRGRAIRKLVDFLKNYR